MREIIPGIKPITADYSPGSLWIPDHDDCYSVKIQIKNISKIDNFRILAELARFGRIKGLLIGELI